MERDLLLVLYCADGGTLSPPRLAELLWDRGDERSPVTLRRHIAGARKAAEGEVVVTRRHGAGATAYGLGIDRDHIDASRFEQQVADGGREFRQDRYAESASTLGRALTLWRGAPLADAGSRSFARAQIARLENTYRTAVLTKLKADISMGQHREATGELEALAMTWPEDGEVRRLLVICLYRSERPIEATRACRQAIGTLLGQGLSDRHLQELQHDMLTGVLPRHGPILAQASRRASPADGGVALAGAARGGRGGEPRSVRPKYR